MTHDPGWKTILAVTVALGSLILLTSQAAPPSPEEIRLRDLFRRYRQGETLTPEEQRILREVRERRQGAAAPGRATIPLVPRGSVGLVPLCDVESPDERGEAGLYGNGRNSPPDVVHSWIRGALEQIQPRDAEGRPSPDGKIVLAAFSMSNAFQEFAAFESLARTCHRRNPAVRIVNTAQGGQAMAEWADPGGRPWKVANERLAQAGYTPAQVQVAWVKVANKARGEDIESYVQRLEEDTVRVLQTSARMYPHLRLVYLGSRIYGGYAVTALNPEPYAYESGRVVRSILQRQASGDPALNPDPTRGAVRSPLVLWGPYLWADGEKGRRCDDLVWRREDFGPDGTHPSSSGCKKVATRLLDFFLTDPTSHSWFVAPEALGSPRAPAEP